VVVNVLRELPAGQSPGRTFLISECRSRVARLVRLMCFEMRAWPHPAMDEVARFLRSAIPTYRLVQTKLRRIRQECRSFRDQRGCGAVREAPGGIVPNITHSSASEFCGEVRNSIVGPNTSRAPYFPLSTM